MFCLCRSCALTSADGECEHTEDEERALTATWVLDEVDRSWNRVTRYSKSMRCTNVKSLNSTLTLTKVDYTWIL